MVLNLSNVTLLFLQLRTVGEVDMWFGGVFPTWILHFTRAWATLLPVSVVCVLIYLPVARFLPRARFLGADGSTTCSHIWGSHWNLLMRGYVLGGSEGTFQANWFLLSSGVTMNVMNILQLGWITDKNKKKAFDVTWTWISHIRCL